MINKKKGPKRPSKRNEYLDELTFDSMPSSAKRAKIEDEDEEELKKRADQPVPVLGPN